MDDEDKAKLTRIAGILVALLAVFTLLATISYFFTWKADQSSLSSAVGDTSVEVSNMAGKMGYRWADLLVRRWFGLGSLAFVVILFAVSVRLLLHRWHYSMVKTTLLTFSGALLSSFILAFVSDLSGLGNAFGGGLGGECGVGCEMGLGCFRERSYGFHIGFSGDCLAGSGFKTVLGLVDVTGEEKGAGGKVPSTSSGTGKRLCRNFGSGTFTIGG